MELPAPLFPLNETEKNTIRQCVIAVLDGPFIDDREFQTRLGFQRPELKAILSSQPHLDYESEDPIIRDAINNCMNEIANGVRISQAEWDQWFTVSRPEVRTTFRKWLALSKGPTPP